MKKKVVVITGPTAVGKSDYAVNYAIANNGEIISADSRQVYKGLNIGTGKITQEEMKGVPHYLLDVVDLNEKFNVDKYKILAQKAIENIHNRGKLPVICGGTGFYIDAVIYNISYPHVPHNENLREELEEKEPSELFSILNKLDPIFSDTLNNSEKNNPHRLIRHIEVATTLGRIPHIEREESPYDVEFIVLKMDLIKLKEKIYSRLIKRLDNGMVEEVEDLHKNGLSWERMEEIGLEYRYIARYLQEQISKEEMIELLKNKIWQYAKNQIGWMKRY